MVDLTATYLGLKLKNPIIAGSSGLTNTLEDIKELENAGVGAIVLKSVFEEEIRKEKNSTAPENSEFPYANTMDFYRSSDVQTTLNDYLDLISKAKKETDIPIIGSINCVTAENWISFAKKIEDAGADAIELNIFLLPSDINNSSEYIEDLHFEIIKKVKASIDIPISVKISFYFSNLSGFIKKLSETGINGIVLFNRSYNIDFNIANLEVVSSNIFSTPGEIIFPLRWIAIMASRTSCDLAASTGVHNGKGVIKQLLAGASAVQVVSTLYKNGKSYVTIMLDEIVNWMSIKGFNKISDFHGKMSREDFENPAEYERVQFMKFYSGK